MCAYCRAPRIILRQGATRGPPLAVVSVLHCSGQPPAVPPPSQPLQETSTAPPPDQGEIPTTQNLSESQNLLGLPVLPREPQDKRVDRHIDACRTSASHHTPSSTQHHRIVHQRTTDLPAYPCSFGGCCTKAIRICTNTIRI